MTTVEHSAGQPGAVRGSEHATGQQAPGPFSPAAALALLFERASSNLSTAELAWLERESIGSALTLAADAQRVSEGIAALVSSDATSGSGLGMFESADDVSHLLNHMHASFQQIGSLLELSQAAGNASIGRGGL